LYKNSLKARVGVAFQWNSTLTAFIQNEITYKTYISDFLYLEN